MNEKPDWLDDVTVMRIAGNIASGILAATRPDLIPSIQIEPVATAAVAIARRIVEKVSRK